MNAPNVRVTPDVSQKYIVAKVIGHTELLLWGNPNIEWHKDIAAEMESTGFTIEEVRGGGRIMLETEPKTIHVWGKSSIYGEATFEEARSILKIAYPNFTITNNAPVDEDR